MVSKRKTIAKVVKIHFLCQRRKQETITKVIQNTKEDVSPVNQLPNAQWVSSLSYTPFYGKQWELVLLSLGFPLALTQATHSLQKLSARHYQIVGKYYLKNMGVKVLCFFKLLNQLLFICCKKIRKNKEPFSKSSPQFDVLQYNYAT